MTTTSFLTRLRSRMGWVLGAVLIAVLAACGADQVAGIQGSGSPVAAGATAQGPITGFGSIFLDGVEYSTSSAQITVDGQSSTELQLRVGYVVTVRGTVNSDGKTGTATSVAFSQDLRGPVSQIDTTASTFVILGQTVRVTDATLFDDTIAAGDITGLQNGSSYEVSGFVDANGALVANRIEPASVGATLQVRGTVKSLDTAGHKFNIGALVVDYTTATVNGTLAEGSVVTVRGLGTSSGGALVATQVDVSNGNGAAANDKGQLEGVITKFTSSTDFVVGAQRVTVSSSTELVLRGTTLALNVPVKVRGTYNASGVLEATRVEVKPNSDARVRGLVDSVSTSAGTLTILGVTVTPGSTTTYDDKSSTKLKSFKFSDIRTGDYIEARGTAGTGANLTATLVERDTAENRSYLRGPVSNLANPNFTILGVNVMIDANTQFLGLGSQAIAAATFFAQAAGKTVKVRGTLSGNVFLADRVQIDN